MLTPAELAGMQAEELASYPSVAVVHRHTETQDASGWVSSTGSNTATVACRVMPVRGQEAERGGRLTSITGWRILFPVGTDVRPSDHLLIEGAEFEVIANTKGQSEPIELSVDARKVS